MNFLWILLDTIFWILLTYIKLPRYFLDISWAGMQRKNQVQVVEDYSGHGSPCLLMPNQCHDYVCIRGNLILDCVRGIWKVMIEIYGLEYLRAPSDGDTGRLLAKSEDSGWPTMLGSVDSMHWTWRIVLLHGKVSIEGIVMI